MDLHKLGHTFYCLIISIGYSGVFVKGIIFRFFFLLLKANQLQRVAQSFYLNFNHISVQVYKEIKLPLQKQ